MIEPKYHNGDIVCFWDKKTDDVLSGRIAMTNKIYDHTTPAKADTIIRYEYTVHTEKDPLGIKNTYSENELYPSLFDCLDGEYRIAEARCKEIAESYHKAKVRLGKIQDAIMGWEAKQ